MSRRIDISIFNKRGDIHSSTSDCRWSTSLGPQC
jgi:hypothetical protein